MNIRLLRIWDALRASYWFLPVLMTVGAVGLAQGMLLLDQELIQRGIEAVWLHGVGEPEGARALLSTVAGSTITVAGVTFSTILVALSLTSSQFGPRLLRGFLRDRLNQAVLGTFVAIYTYCLLVLRNVPLDVATRTVPQFSVLAALVLAIVGVFVFILFIHHATTSIQASHVVAVAGAELDEAIRHAFPERTEDDRRWGAESADDLLPKDFRDTAVDLASTGSGYVQEIDVTGLIELAAEVGLVVELLHDRGAFLASGQTVARTSTALDDETRERLLACVVLGPARASSRDLVQGIAQLSEIAVRSLSPGINDPFTASAALRRLGQSLLVLGVRRLPTPNQYDGEGQLRVVMPTLALEEVLHLAFDQVRHYGRGDPHVPIVLLEVLTTVGAESSHPGLRRLLRQHAEVVHRASTEALGERTDRDRVDRAFRTACLALGGMDREAAKEMVEGGGEDEETESGAAEGDQGY